MELTLSLLVPLVLASASRGDNWTPPAFCHDGPCPEFSVIESNGNFEKRRYVATEWISTKVGSVGEASEGAVMAASSKMKSFCGQQTETVCATLNEAWPVLLTRTQDGEVWYSWFVPPGTSLTEVADSSVQKETRPESTVYVRTFGGFPSLHTGQSNAEALSHDLGKSCATYTGAAYDHYFSFRHHNEIWITEEELMLCT